MKEFWLSRKLLESQKGLAKLGTRLAGQRVELHPPEAFHRVPALTTFVEALLGLQARTRRT